MKFDTPSAMPWRVVELNRLEGMTFSMTLDNEQRVRERAVVNATGVRYRQLPIDRLEVLEVLEGAGVSYAATEREARYCRDTEAIIIDSSNSAGQAAMFVGRSAKHVRVPVHGDSLASSMSRYLCRWLDANPAIMIDKVRISAPFTGSTRLKRLRSATEMTARPARSM